MCEEDRRKAICANCENKPGCWTDIADMPDGCTRWDVGLAEAFAGSRRPSPEEMEIIERECGSKSCEEVCGRFKVYYCPIK